jgi:ubiquinone biosynthesis UbiH/UbiF/VisC/COQ6 family hydroxylase
VNFDLIVVGAGPVGLAVAAAARGLSVALVANAGRAPAPVSGVLDARVYTLSPGNVSFLRDLRAWQSVASERVTPVHGMRVFGDRGAKIEFDAYRAGVPELAWTVEDGVLQDALWGAVDARENMVVLAPAECTELIFDSKKALLKLRDGRELTAALVVGADGASSFVRQQAGIPIKTNDYAQAAVIANLECEKPHANIAYQWFQGGPVLALLPLPGRRVSMIWSLPEEDAEMLLQLEPDALCRTVESATAGALGAISVVTPPRSYPLRRLSAARMAGERVALAGDAAHVIHPLAGQGLNLGLQDARALAAALAGRGPRDAGDERLLRRYERTRAEPILAMDLMVDGLFRLFGADSEPLSRLRNAGLNLSGRLPVLKNILIRHAMS